MVVVRVGGSCSRKGDSISLTKVLLHCLLFFKYNV